MEGVEVYSTGQQTALSFQTLDGCPDTLQANGKDGTSGPDGCATCDVATTWGAETSFRLPVVVLVAIYTVQVQHCILGKELASQI